MDKDKALELIAKMLKLADDQGASDGEVQAALGRAAHLARKHNISDIEVQKAREAAGADEFEIKIDPKTMVKRSAYEANSLTRWDKHLCSVAAKASDTGAYISTSIGYQSIIFYGLPADVAFAIEVYKACRDMLSKRARRWAKSQRDLGFDVNSRSLEVRSYKDGFVHGMFEVVSKEQEQETDERVEINNGSQMALVPVADIAAAKKGALTAFSRGLALKKSRRSRRDHDPGAYRAGKRAGSSENLGRGVLR